jgi:hypothetical protein
MKHITFILILFTSTFACADAWDNLTLEEANAVVAELKENPYIFDYCDCCSHSGEYETSVHLLKVIKTEIVQCSWSEEHYSVKIGFEIIAALNYTAKGPNIKKLKQYSGAEISDVLYMNYTWTLDRDSKLASPFFNTVDYSTYGESTACKKDFPYPLPKAVSKVSKDKEYASWYRDNVK